MNLPACIHCQHEPERREHAGRVMFICPVCNNHGDASPSELWAKATWRQVNRDDLPMCARCDHPPRFKLRRSEWWGCCTGCSYATGAMGSLQGAVAGWLRSVR